MKKKISIKEAIDKGIKAHRAGNWQEADRYYTAILNEIPGHADANHNLGVLAVRFDKPILAQKLFQNAILSNPEIKQYWLSSIENLVSCSDIEGLAQLKDRCLELNLQPLLL